MYIPQTLEGRLAWLLSVVAVVSSLIATGALIRLGPETLLDLRSVRLLFPFVVLADRWTESFWDVPVALLFLQFPLYAVAIVVAGVRGGLRPALAAIAIAHAVAAAIALTIPGAG